MYLSQIAVSKQIAELEGIVGVLHFNSIRKRLVFNPSGTCYEAAIKLLLAEH